METFGLQGFAGFVLVEEADLRDGGGADEAGALVELRASLHAAAAGDAARERVHLFLNVGSHARAGAEVVGAVDGDPGFDGLEVLEEDAAVDREIANDGKLGERLETDGLFELVDESGAG